MDLVRISAYLNAPGADAGDFFDCLKSASPAMTTHDYSITSPRLAERIHGHVGMSEEAGHSKPRLSFVDGLER